MSEKKETRVKPESKTARNTHIHTWIKIQMRKDGGGCFRGRRGGAGRGKDPKKGSMCGNKVIVDAKTSPPRY